MKNPVDTKQRTEIRRILSEASERQYPNYGHSFQTPVQFQEALENCYSLIASRTALAWKQNIGMSLDFSSAIFQNVNWYYADLIPFVSIHSDSFQDLFKTYRRNGRKKKIPYSLALKALEAERIIEVDKGYSNGIDKGRHYAKSYRLHRDFLLPLMDSFLIRKRTTENKIPSIYDCLCAYFHGRLLERKLNEAKIIYERLQPHEGLSVSFPRNWKKQVCAFGFFSFDNDLDLLNLVSDLRYFEKHADYGYTAGRHYDWFVSCSSSFRKYIHLGGKSYHELIDCHSGFFWMFALYGYAKGKIGADECKGMIDECFDGKFYENISQQPKSRAVKIEFMKVMNMTKRQVNAITKYQPDGLFSRIRERLASTYPQWSSFLEAIRAEPKMRNRIKIGKFNHYALTRIERHIMDELKRRLEARGLKGLRRVHDALWGVDDIDEAEIMPILKTVVYDYMEKVRPPMLLAA